MQYFKPEGNFFVGDCMPFFHDGIFRLYYLLDEGHFGAPGGYGGHQWAQASSPDLVHWTHHPLAIPLTKADEGAICTGSVFVHDGVYYGFYSTRRRDWKQHISLAKSADGINFTKTEPNPLVAPPRGYHPNHYRDPAVFRDEAGMFHMLVTTLLDDYPVSGRGGCLEHLVSRDLVNWEHKGPLLIPGFADVPECSDYFGWNGWYYLVFSNGGVARYRMSRRPLGPWLRPAVDILDGGLARVMKTAAFTGNRRIGVSWLGGRAGGKDNGVPEFAGNAVFRELVQQADGTLGARFLPEMIPQGTKSFVPAPASLTAGALCKPGKARLRSGQGLAAALVKEVPHNFHLTARISGGSGPGVFGLRFRRSDQPADYGCDRSYDICIDPTEKTLCLNAQRLARVEGLRRTFQLDLVALGSIIDLCVDNRRCLIDRCPEQHGANLMFYAWDAAATFDNISIHMIDEFWDKAR